jgi:hypothetical protein
MQSRSLGKDLASLEKTAFNPTTAMVTAGQWAKKSGKRLYGMWQGLSPFEKITVGLTAASLLPLIWPDKNSSEYSHMMEKYSGLSGMDLVDRLNKTAMMNYGSVPSVNALPNMHMSAGFANASPAKHMLPGHSMPNFSVKTAHDDTSYLKKQANPAISSAISAARAAATSSLAGMSNFEKASLGLQALATAPALKEMLPTPRTSPSDTEQPYFNYKQASASQIGKKIMGVVNHPGFNVGMNVLQTIPMVQSMFQGNPNKPPKPKSQTYESGNYKDYKQAYSVTDAMQKEAYVQALIPLARGAMSLARPLMKGLKTAKGLNTAANVAQGLNTAANVAQGAAAVKGMIPNKNNVQQQQPQQFNYKQAYSVTDAMQKEAAASNFREGAKKAVSILGKNIFDTFQGQVQKNIKNMTSKALKLPDPPKKTEYKQFNKNITKGNVFDKKAAIVPTDPPHTEPPISPPVDPESVSVVAEVVRNPRKFPWIKTMLGLGILGSGIATGAMMSAGGRHHYPEDDRDRRREGDFYYKQKSANFTSPYFEKQAQYNFLNKTASPGGFWSRVGSGLGTAGKAVGKYGLLYPLIGLSLYGIGSGIGALMNRNAHYSESMLDKYAARVVRPRKGNTFPSPSIPTIQNPSTQNIPSTSNAVKPLTGRRVRGYNQNKPQTQTQEQPLQTNVEKGTLLQDGTAFVKNHWKPLLAGAAGMWAANEFLNRDASENTVDELYKEAASAIVEEELPKIESYKGSYNNLSFTE